MQSAIQTRRRSTDHVFMSPFTEALIFLRAAYQGMQTDCTQPLFALLRSRNGDDATCNAMPRHCAACEEDCNDKKECNGAGLGHSNGIDS